jgi:ketosteroid isomerase-like protein
MMAIALATALSTAQSDLTTTRELEQIEQQLAATWQRGDCDGWAALVDEGWSVIHITGNIITRAEVLELCHAPRPQGQTHHVDDVRVRVFGDTAVVTGRTVVTGAAGAAGEETVGLRFTDVFVRRAGRWKAVASHATRLTP